MASSNKHLHITLDERRIIEIGIRNNSTKTAIARTLGKDKSTIAREIRLHRYRSHKCSLPLECNNYKHCGIGRHCRPSCPGFVPFSCYRRDRSPGACNGCSKANSCRFDHFRYDPSIADDQYRKTLSAAREGINISESHLIEIGSLLGPLIRQGLSPYAILQSHPEIDISEKTIYTYIEDGTFKRAGVDLGPLDLRRQVSRKIKKKDKNHYKQRKDNKYLIGRSYKDFLNYINEHPSARVVQMDTVYNGISQGPFMQTFKFLRYSFTLIIYHDTKTAKDMVDGILLLETILGAEMFDTEVEVLLTDRGTEFTLADAIEHRNDGTMRTRIFYCDPMQSTQKGSLENNHEEIRYICPKGTDLHKLGLNGQDDANLITSHINSFPKERLNGKTPFEMLKFLNPEMAERFIQFGIVEIEKDKVILRPYLLKK